MTRLAAFALLLTAGGLLAGCTFEHRIDGGSPLHTDNGALEAHREAVEAAGTRLVTEPLVDGPMPAPAATVPTPRLGTVAQGEAAAPNSGAMATPPTPTTSGAATPAGTTPAAQ